MLTLLKVLVQLYLLHSSDNACLKPFGRFKLQLPFRQQLIRYVFYYGLSLRINIIFTCTTISTIRLHQDRCQEVNYFTDIQMYTIVHDNAPSKPNEMFKTNSHLHTYNTRKNKFLYFPKYNRVAEQIIQIQSY